jgi:serine/threonine protein kinase
MKKSSTTESSNDGLVFLDWNAIERQRTRQGLSRVDLCAVMAMSINTYNKIKADIGVNPSTAGKLFKFFKCRDNELLSPRDPRYELPQPVGRQKTDAAEWIVDDHNRTSRRASNELIYVISKMKHQYTANRRGRGKYYVLSGVPQSTKKDWQHKLARHADVCAAVGVHHNIALNLSSTPTADNEGWWVIDQWVGTETLEDKCKTGSWPRSKLPQLLFDIASGLQALHNAKVVFRELHPARVLINESDGRVVLTDFELGKLLEGGPSVSSDWPEDPFRAPEVDSGNVTPRSDFYSLGKVAVFAAAGTIDDDVDAETSFTQVGMPAKISDYLLKCLEPLPSCRPENLAPLLKELSRWATKEKR